MRLTAEEIVDNELPDEIFVELVEAGRKEIRHDPELTNQAQEQLSVDMGDLVQRIMFELGLN